MHQETTKHKALCPEDLNTSKKHEVKALPFVGKALNLEIPSKNAK